MTTDHIDRIDRFDRIDVVDVNIPCIIGVYAEERLTPQPLLVSLGFALDVRRAANEGDLKHTVDYARVMGEVEFVLQECAFLLIESAAEVIAAIVLAGHAVVDELTVTVKKPQALGGNGLPSLTIRRRRDASAGHWSYGFGNVDVVHNTPGVGVYRLHLRGGQAAVMPPHVRCFHVEGGRRGKRVMPQHDGPLRLHSDVNASYVVVASPPLALDAFTRG
jgi:FolB domain-containing protein